MSHIKTLFISLIVGLLLTWAVVHFHGINEDAIRLLIRGSAKISVVLFLIAFGASSLHYFIKHKRVEIVLQNRGNIGLAFAVAHTFHLAFLLWLQGYIHPVFTLAKTSSLIGGGMAYVFMYLMVITTFSKPRNWLSPSQWRLLHLVGGYWIYTIFFKSYLKQVMHQDRGYILFALLVLTLVLRILSYYKKR